MLRSGRITGFDWDEHNLAHAERHCVSADEIEEVIGAGRSVLKKNPSAVDRYFAFGKTAAGRRLTIVFAFRSETGTARPISAREMTKGERTKHDR